MSQQRRAEPTYVLTTRVERLLRDWQRQLPSPDFSFGDESELRRELRAPGPRVWICDAGDDRAGWECHSDTVRIIVGQPQNPAYEALRLQDPRAFFLSYVESQARLDLALKTAAVVAEQNAIITLLRARGAHPERLVRSEPPPASSDRGDDWQFLETALASLDHRDQLLAEFQRTLRSRLGSLRAVVMVRDGADFRGPAGDPAAPCPATAPFVSWLEERAALLDLDAWDGDADPVAEVEVRRRMHQWRLRLIVPLIVRNRVQGWIGVGPRADGSSHDDHSRLRALGIARLFETLLDRNERGRSQARLEQTQREYRAHLPGARILTASQALTEDLPPVVRAAVGDAFQTGRLAVHEPKPGSPLRVAATPIPGDRVAVLWMDCSTLVSQGDHTRHSTRLAALTEVGLLVQHQLGNALQIASTVQELLAAGEMPPEAVTARFAADLERLVKFQRLLGALNSAAASAPEPTPAAAVAKELQAALGIPVSLPEPALVMLADRRLLVDALSALLSAAAPAAGTMTGVSFGISRRGDGETRVILIALRGLRQVPAGLPGSPTGQHADLEVFVARELIERQGGAVEVADGVHGPELHVLLAEVPASAEPGTDPSAAARFRLTPP